MDRIFINISRIVFNWSKLFQFTLTLTEETILLTIIFFLLTSFIYGVTLSKDSKPKSSSSSSSTVSWVTLLLIYSGTMDLLELALVTLTPVEEEVGNIDFLLDLALSKITVTSFWLLDSGSEWIIKNHALLFHFLSHHVFIFLKYFLTNF